MVSEVKTNIYFQLHFLTEPLKLEKNRPLIPVTCKAEVIVYTSSQLISIDKLSNYDTPLLLYTKINWKLIAKEQRCYKSSKMPFYFQSLKVI